MIYTYDSGKSVSPFIITQIGEYQNQFILSSNEMMMGQKEMTYALYSILNGQNEYSSFFRIFTLEKHFVVTYYWSTDIPEVFSNRKGLFVIIGLMFSRKIWGKLKNDIIEHTKNFFIAIRDLFDINLDDLKSDKFHLLLQEDSEKKMKELYEKYEQQIRGVPLLKKSQHFELAYKDDLKKLVHASLKINKNVSLERTQNKLVMVISSSDEVSFLNNLSVIINEFIISDGIDISAAVSPSKSLYGFIQNGDVIPSSVISLCLREVCGIKYIVFECE